MTIVTLTAMPSQAQSEFLNLTLKLDDAILLTSPTISLAYSSKPFQTKAFVRAADATMCGGKLNSDWDIISDATWCQLALAADKVVTW
jgi:hypothetical protein